MGLELRWFIMGSPIVENKRFWPFRLTGLIDKWSYKVNETSKELPNNTKDIADWIINNHRYPMYAGKPDDKHTMRCFHGMWENMIKRDYWQTPEETLEFGVGDCEDVAMLATTLIGKILDKSEVYTVLGVVKDASGILGGHGWTYAKYNGDWHYLEMTRRNAPDDYPVVNNIREPYEYRNWKLDPYVLFNWTNFEELKKGLIDYLGMTFNAKETRKKYEALSEMNEEDLEPIQRTNLLSKIRWRR